ncbi:type II secretion system protein N [Porticoccus sp. W117]|uniref:type II secretion system protein N n=1 Tax=Porticoccus sp. W117 TaxID=3054777 RepID=UPI0025945A0E|nr:type II secretion system protein N [Porticoccus sp. W117]MDM3869754.1 type II secretion system protein N [Porticoccus sp. W117]
MSKLKYAITLGAALFLLHVIANAPAHLIQWFIPQQLTFQAAHYQGSLWNGSARQLVMGSQGATVALDAMKWRLKPLSLLTFSPAAEVNVKLAGSDIVTGELQWLGGQRWGGENLEVNLPANWVGRYGVGYPLAGDLSLQLTEVQADGQRIASIAGNGSWQRARLELGGQWLGLGTLAGDLAMQGEKIKLNFFDLSGPWDLDGQVLLNPDGKMEINGLVSPPPQTAESIIQGLSLFGERQQNGSYRIEFTY